MLENAPPGSVALSLTCLKSKNEDRYESLPYPTFSNSMKAGFSAELKNPQSISPLYSWKQLDNMGRDETPYQSTEFS